ncbi:MAG: hypothetical protein N2203_05860 [Bacteroidia bacterium]|nr:hypothetical protein [Bacteroidia bacterium]
MAQTKNDSIEFQLTYEKAYNLRNINPDSSMLLINKLVKISQLAGKKEWMAKSFNLKGVVHYKKNEYLKSFVELEKALKYTNNDELKGKIFINLGNTLSDMGYTYSAIEYYQEAIRVFHKVNNQKFLVRALMNLASEEFGIGQTINARNHLKLALYYAKEYQMLEEEAMCLNNLSAMFIHSGLIDSASHYIYQSFNAYEQTENYFGLADAYLTSIELHLEKHELNYAKSLIDLADSIIDHLQYLEGKKLLTSEKVNYYLYCNDFHNASKYFNLYLQLEDSLNKRKNQSKNILMPTIQTPTNGEKTRTPIYFSFFQLVLIFVFSVSIFVFILKNYRNVKE